MKQRRRGRRRKSQQSKNLSLHPLKRSSKAKLRPPGSYIIREKKKFHVHWLTPCLFGVWGLYLSSHRSTLSPHTSSHRWWLPFIGMHILVWIRELMCGPPSQKSTVCWQDAYSQMAPMCLRTKEFWPQKSQMPVLSTRRNISKYKLKLYVHSLLLKWSESFHINGIRISIKKAKKKKKEKKKKKQLFW